VTRNDSSSLSKYCNISY